MKDVNAFSDGMEQELIGRIPEILRGCVYDEKTLTEAIRKLEQQKEKETAILEDICTLIRENL